MEDYSLYVRLTSTRRGAHFVLVPDSFMGPKPRLRGCPSFRALTRNSPTSRAPLASGSRVRRVARRRLRSRAGPRRAARCRPSPAVARRYRFSARGSANHATAVAPTLASRAGFRAKIRARAAGGRGGALHRFGGFYATDYCRAALRGLLRKNSRTSASHSSELAKSLCASPSLRASVDTLRAQYAIFHFLPVSTRSAGERNPLAGWRRTFAR